MAGRLPGTPKTGGRKRGSLDKNERIALTADMAGSILRVFKKLGGEKFLLEWAQENKTEFVRQCLGRLMPAFPKDDPEVVNNTQINVNQLSEFEAARRVAFLLSKATHEQEERVVAEQPIEPVEPASVEAEPPRPDLPVTAEEKAEQAALEQYPARGCWPPVPEPKPEVTLETYRGSRAEQRGYPSEEIRRPRLPRRR